MATLASLDSQSHYAPGEWEARVDLAAAYRLVALYGWDDLIFTHLSARVPSSESCAEHHFLINPYDMMFEEITALSLAGGKEASIPVQSLMTAAPGTWGRFAVRLSCFATAGVDMTKVSQPFALGTADALGIDVSQVRIASAPEASGTCPR